MTDMDHERIALERALDSLTRTVNALEKTVGILQESVGSLEKSYGSIREFIFGRDDPVTLKHYPGLRDRVYSDGLYVKVGVGMVGVLALHSLGIPVDWVGKALMAWLHVPGAGQ